LRSDRPEIGQTYPGTILLGPSSPGHWLFKRARQLANLKRENQKPKDQREEWGSKSSGGPGPLPPISTHKELIELARSYTAQAIATIYQIMLAPGRSARDRILCAQFLVERGWGKAPLLVKIAGDEDPTAREAPKLTEMPREEWSKQVLEILIKAGRLKLARWRAPTHRIRRTMIRPSSSGWRRPPPLLQRVMVPEVVASNGDAASSTSSPGTAAIEKRDREAAWDGLRSTRLPLMSHSVNSGRAREPRGGEHGDRNIRRAFSHW
jgi:hypothetical protein